MCGFLLHPHYTCVSKSQLSHRLERPAGENSALPPLPYRAGSERRTTPPLQKRRYRNGGQSIGTPTANCHQSAINARQYIRLWRPKRLRVAAGAALVFQGTYLNNYPEAEAFVIMKSYGRAFGPAGFARQCLRVSCARRPGVGQGAHSSRATNLSPT